MDDLDVFYNLLDFYYEGILIFNEKMEIEFANKKALEVFKYNQEQSFQGKTIDDFILSRNFRQYLYHKVENHEDIVEEEHIIGSPLVRVVRVNLLSFQQKDGFIYLLTFMDITRKKLEEIKNRRKENIASMVNLAAGLAHEIKNPLASIDIHLRLLSRFLGNAPEFQEKKEMDHFLGVLQEELSRLNSIVQDFLASLRPISLDLKKVSLEQIIDDLVSFLSLEMSENQILVSVEVEDLLPTVLGDQKYLRIVFLNLLKNAIEAFPEDQKDRAVKIKLSENYPFIEILIQDNGKGISPENMEKIFEPYFTTKSYGTGIGLTMIHKIIMEHSGNIKVDSGLGKGTTFTVMLPQYKGETAKYLESGEE